MTGEPLALGEGEHIEQHAAASFRGSIVSSVRLLGSGLARRKAYGEWRDAMNLAGLPDLPEDMVLVLTNHRLLIGRPRWFGGAPRSFRAEVSFDQIAEVVTVRHGLTRGAALALRNGCIVEVEALRGRRLRRLVDALHRRVAGDAG